MGRLIYPVGIYQYFQCHILGMQHWHVREVKGYSIMTVYYFAIFV